MVEFGIEGWHLARGTSPDGYDVVVGNVPFRSWFVEAGMSKVSFDGDPERFGVGVARNSFSLRQHRPTTIRLFRFRR